MLLQIDWSLIFVFAAMFIDVGLFTRLPPLQPAFAAIAGLSDGGVYALGVGLSQIVSNVPATILLLNYVPSSAQLAYAVNAGGFGLAVGSLANLIALRMAGAQDLVALPLLLAAAAGVGRAGRLAVELTLIAALPGGQQANAAGHW